MFSALADRFLTTGPPGTSLKPFLMKDSAYTFGLSRQPHQNTTWQPNIHDRATPVTARHSQRFSFTLTSLHHLTMLAMPSPLSSPAPCSPWSQIPWSLIFLSLSSCSYGCHKIHSQTLLHLMRLRLKRLKYFLSDSATSWQSWNLNQGL